MVTAHPEVCRYSVYLFVTVVAHPVPEETEIAVHEGEAFVFGSLSRGVLVLVEAVEPASLAEPVQYFTTVPSSSKGKVSIHSLSLDIQPIYRFVQQDGDVILRDDHYALSISDSKIQKKG